MASLESSTPSIWEASHKSGRRLLSLDASSPPVLKVSTSGASYGSNTTAPTTTSSDDSGSVYTHHQSCSLRTIHEEDGKDNKNEKRVFEEDEGGSNSIDISTFVEDWLEGDGSLIRETREQVSEMPNCMDHVQRHHHHHLTQPQSFQQQPRPIALNRAVCFGWIKHPPTRLWREVVKTFSDDHDGYPTWNVDVCNQVITSLKEKGVDLFLTCRGQSTGSNRQKIPTKQDCLGGWRVATPQEVYARTWQRFKDGRKTKDSNEKQQQQPSRKRPRGRPPKLDGPMVSFSSETQSEPPSPHASSLAPSSPSVSSVSSSAESSSLVKILKSLQHDLAKYRSCIGDNLENGPSTERCRLDHLRDRLCCEPSRMSPEVTTRLWRVAQDFGFLQQFICNKIEAAVGSQPAIVTKQGSNVLPDIPDLSSIDHKMNSTKASSASDDHTHNPTAYVPETLTIEDVNFSTAGRRRSGTICPNDVCFDWNMHEGTDGWQKVVYELSLNTADYPEWEDCICDLVQAKLVAERGQHSFCSFLDDHGLPCETIASGLWYYSTQEEIREKTKEQFLWIRDVLRDGFADDNLQDMGKPPQGGSKGSDDSNEDGDGFGSCDDDPHMDGNNQSDSSMNFAGHDSGHHSTCTLSLAPHEHLTPGFCSSNTRLIDIKADTEPSPRDDDDASSDDTVQSDYNPASDDGSVGSDVGKTSFESIDDTIVIADAKVLDSSSAISSDELSLFGTPLLSAECCVVGHRIPNVELSCGLVLVDQPNVSIIEPFDITKIPLEKDSMYAEDAVKEDAMVIVRPAAVENATLPLSTEVIVNGEGPPDMPITVIPRLTRNTAMFGAQLNPTNTTYGERSVSGSEAVVGFLGNNGDVANAVVLHSVPVVDPDTESPSRVTSICEEIAASRDAYRVISEKLSSKRWRKVLSTLTPYEFGRVIENIKLEFDRPRVAEFLASRLVDEQGVQGFTCQHAAMALQHTSFRGTMAERLLPYCVDLSSDLSTVKQELNDWDVSLLLISLCRKVQSVTL